MAVPTIENTQISTNGASTTSIQIPALSGGESGDIVAVFVSLRQTSNSVETCQTASSSTGLTLMRRGENDQGQNSVELWAGKGSQFYGEAIDITTSQSRPLGAISILIRGALDDTLSNIFATLADNSNPSGSDDADMLVSIANANADALMLACGGSRAGEIENAMHEDDIEIDWNNLYGSGGDVTSLHCWKQERVSAVTQNMGAAGCLDSDRDWIVVAAEVRPAASDPEIRLPIDDMVVSNTNLGNTNTASITVYNDGGSDLTLSNPSFVAGNNFIAGDWSVITSFPLVINPGSAEIELEFSPSVVPGTQEGTFQFDTDDPENTTASFDFQGGAIGSGEIIDIIVDPSNQAGTDFTLLNSAIAAKADDYVALNFSIRYRVRTSGSFVDSPNANLTGSITDATHYPRIEPYNINNRASGKYTTESEKYRLNGSGSFNTALYITDKYFSIDGIQIQSNAANNNPLIQIYGASGTENDSQGIIKNCFLLGSDNAAAIDILGYHNVKVVNCCIKAGKPSIKTTASTTGDKVFYYNTVVNSLSYAFTIVNNTTGAMKNNIAKGSTTNDYSLGTGLGGFDMQNNISSDASSPNTAFRNLDVGLINVSQNDFHLAPANNPAAKQATPLHSDPTEPVTTDIDGNTRSTTTPDIGADEIASKGKNQAVITLAKMATVTCEAIIDIDLLQVLRINVKNSEAQNYIMFMNTTRMQLTHFDTLTPGTSRITTIDRAFYEGIAAFFNSGEQQYEIDSSLLSVSLQRA